MTPSPSASRRDFLSRSCSVIAVLAAGAGATALLGCDSAGANEPQFPEGVTRDGGHLAVELDRFPNLTRNDGMLWIEAADVVVVNDDKRGYRAFTSICPHDRKDVKEFTGTELRCPSHGWTFDLDGKPTGKSTAALTGYPVEVVDGILQIAL